MKVKKVSNGIATAVFGFSTMAFVGPQTTDEGMAICAGLLAVSGAWLGRKEIARQINRLVINRGYAVVEVLEPEPIRPVYTGVTHISIGQYPRVNPYYDRRECL